MRRKFYVGEQYKKVIAALERAGRKYESWVDYWSICGHIYEVKVFPRA